jgi:hypothetical protein
MNKGNNSNRLAKQKWSYLRSLDVSKIKTNFKRSGFTLTGHDFDKKTRGTKFLRACRPPFLMGFFFVFFFLSGETDPIFTNRLQQ